MQSTIRATTLKPINLLPILRSIQVSKSSKQFLSLGFSFMMDSPLEFGLEDLQIIVSDYMVRLFVGVK